MMQIMLAFGGFWKLRCGNFLSKTYYKIQENKYLAPFIIYRSKSINSQIYSENHHIIITIIILLIPYY